MGHPKALIEMVAADVRRTYPEPKFRYVYEKGLKLTDRRNQPDIQVFKDSTLVCVFEIGYTRPEKLKLYHEQEIKDIRWYDKKGRLQPLYVGNHGEVLRRPVAFSFDENDIWYGAMCGRSNCERLEGRLMEYVEELEKSNNVWLLRKLVRDPIIDEHGTNYPDDLRDLLSSADKDCVALEMARDVSSLNVTSIFTNGKYGFALNYCDICNETTLYYDLENPVLDLDLTYGPQGRYDGLDSFHNFYSWWSNQNRKAALGAFKAEMHISKLCAFIADTAGVTLDLENLQPMMFSGCPVAVQQ
jgi:hypothetical protein